MNQHHKFVYDKEGYMVNSISKFLILILIGFIVGCAHVYDVNYDYDKNANFANLKTYDWMPISQESRESRRNSELVEEAVEYEFLGVCVPTFWVRKASREVKSN
jgi:hypothetical protein